AILVSSCNSFNPVKIDIPEKFIHSLGGFEHRAIALPKTLVGKRRESSRIALFFDVKRHWILLPLKLITVSAPSNTFVQVPRCSPSENTYVSLSSFLFRCRDKITTSHPKSRKTFFNSVPKCPVPPASTIFFIISRPY